MTVDEDPKGDIFCDLAGQLNGDAGHVGTAPNEISSLEWLYGRHDDLTVIECR